MSWPRTDESNGRKAALGGLSIDRLATGCEGLAWDDAHFGDRRIERGLQDDDGLGRGSSNRGLLTQKIDAGLLLCYLR